MNSTERHKAVQVSQRSSIITLLGFLIVISSLVYSAVKLKSLNTRVETKEIEIEQLENKKTQLEQKISHIDTLVKEREEKAIFLENVLETLIDSLNNLRTFKTNQITRKEIKQLTTGASLVLKGKEHYDKAEYDKALSIFQQAAAQNISTAMDYLGLMYSWGKGVPEDLQRSVYWYRKSANLGSARAMYWLGLLYESLELTELDPDSAKIWYSKSAALGDENARRRLDELKAKKPKISFEFTENRQDHKVGLKATNKGDGAAIVEDIKIEYEDRFYNINNSGEFKSYLKAAKIDSPWIIHEKVYVLKEGDTHFLIFYKSNSTKKNGRRAILEKEIVKKNVMIKFKNLGGEEFTINTSISKL